MKVSVKQLRKETNQPLDLDDLEGIKLKLGRSDEEISPEEKPLIDSITKDNILGDKLNLEKRMEMISFIGVEPAEFALERSIGRNDSLYSNFTELIALTKRKVGRIVVIENNKKTSYGTGFMVSNRLLLTNWHIFKFKEMADESEVHFFYEYDALGHPRTPLIFKFDTTVFFNDKNLDYCFVAVNPTDVTGKVSLQSIGYLYLDRAPGKLGDVNVERLNIIHHPNGDYKQISIRENLFKNVTRTTIQYETDTPPGSSGSPVFNDQWQVVGLHHQSVPKMDASKENYLDKDNKVIPIIDRKIDKSRIVWIKNEGIRISVILKHLTTKNPNNDYVAELEIPPPQETFKFSISESKAFMEKKIDNLSSPYLNRNININVPESILNTEKSVDISLSKKNIKAIDDFIRIDTQDDKSDDLFIEIAKVEREQNLDFSKCKGYIPKFLGINVPLPQPKKTLKKQIARLKNDTIELKYFKYSVIFNAVNKMPIISAINVEGDAEKRLDDSKRSDIWLRDKRIDIECQLTDKFYRHSNFDKGHMSRFEDANWDNTEKLALRNGIYTCFYTNACPQVVKLNRAGGFWGKLEKAILEKGIKKEEGKSARMTVFNGPIFNEEIDRIFKGVIIPMQYYKIILWINENKKLKATAFKLSQETLVDHIEFDERMNIDEEALDIDKDVVFKNYQCTIKSLSRLTKINFKHLEKYDTFDTNNFDEEIFIENEESMVL